MITIFTPSFADAADTNAQNLSSKEIVARLDPQRFRVTMLHDEVADPRIVARSNTTLLPWRKRGNTARIAWHIVRHVPDIYFFPREGPLDVTFLRLRRFLRWKTAVVSYVVSGGLYNGPYSQRRERNIRESDLVIANNTYLAELLKEKLEIEATVIHNGIDRRYFFPPPRTGAQQGKVTVLYAGSMRPYKRVPLVVGAAVRWPEVRFRIAGVGEDDKACKTLARKLRCRNVEFLGHLSLADLGEQMRSADIFFFPSVIEGHPQVLGQAAACGLPVVAMKVYRPDYVVDEVTGYLCDTDDELSGRLELLIHRLELRCAMGQAAVAHANKFDWDVIAGKWQEELEEAVAKRQRS